MAEEQKVDVIKESAKEFVDIMEDMKKIQEGMAEIEKDTIPTKPVVIPEMLKPKPAPVIEPTPEPEPVYIPPPPEPVKKKYGLIIALFLIIITTGIGFMMGNNQCNETINSTVEAQVQGIMNQFAETLAKCEVIGMKNGDLEMNIAALECIPP